MQLNFSFPPDPLFTGTYKARVYDAASPEYIIAEQSATSPFGSLVYMSIDNVPDALNYLIKIVIVETGIIAGQLTLTPGRYTYHRVGTFYKNDCPSGQAGSKVIFSKAYVSVISEANAKAQSDSDDANFNQSGQAFANAMGSCKVVILPVPFEFTRFGTAFTLSDSNESMSQAPAPYHNSYYSYFYKNLNTGHYVLSLYFQYISAGKDNRNSGYQDCACVMANLNKGIPAPIAKITDPSLFPITQIPITGTGYKGRVINGYIGTDGYLYITDYADHSICCNDEGQPTKYMMRFSYLTNAAEFLTQGIFNA